MALLELVALTGCLSAAPSGDGSEADADVDSDTDVDSDSDSDTGSGSDDRPEPDVAAPFALVELFTSEG